MTLREAIVGEGGELVVDDGGHVVGNAVCAHTFVEPLLEPFHALGGTLRPHGLAQQVGLGGREVGNIHGHLHELLLEQRHAERLLQRSLQQRVQVGDRLLAVSASDVRVHRTALDGAGPDERDLNDKVVERTRLQPGQRGHLGPALDLEHADGVRPADHLVDVWLLLDEPKVDLGAMMLLDEVDPIMKRA